MMVATSAPMVRAGGLPPAAASGRRVIGRGGANAKASPKRIGRGEAPAGGVPAAGRDGGSPGRMRTRQSWKGMSRIANADRSGA
ncbi:hypothetical protein JCM2811A_30840 [Methylorubrum rhodinum]